MTRTELINRLEAIGYEAIATETIKNGVTLEGVQISNGTNCRPVMYSEAYEGKTFDEIVTLIENAFKHTPDYECFSDPEFVSANIYIGLQRKHECDLVTREFEPCASIEQYLYIVSADRTASVRVTESLLAHIGMNTETAWMAAENNTFNETLIQPLGNVLAAMIPDFPTADDCGVWVISNSQMNHGAAAVLHSAAIKEQIAEKIGINTFAVLPSSIHEVLLVPMTDNTNIEKLSRLVREVNEAQVEPLEQLADEAFIITV